MLARANASAGVYNKLLESDNIRVSFVLNGAVPDEESYIQKIIEATVGAVFDTPDAEEVKQYILSFLIVNTYKIVTANNYEPVVLDAVLRRDSQTDTDKDELYDWNEVDTEAIYTVKEKLPENEGGDKELRKKPYLLMTDMPTIQQCITYYGMENLYVESGFERFRNDEWADGMPSSAFEEHFDTVLNERHITPIWSDPTNVDSDGDMLCDKCDNYKLRYQYISEIFSDYICSGVVECCTLRVSDDGFILVNEPINNIIKKYGITDEEFLAYYDDWFFFSVSYDQESDYGLCKLRPGEVGAGVAVPFYSFDINNFTNLCNEKNAVELEKELDNYIEYKTLIPPSELLLKYFCDTSNTGSYILANTYVNRIILYEDITDVIKYTELNIHQKSIYDSLATDIEKANKCFYLCDVNNLTNLEKNKILLIRSGNPSVYSFAAEIYYHALMTNYTWKIISDFFQNPSSLISQECFVSIFAMNKLNGLLTTTELISVEMAYALCLLPSFKMIFINATIQLFEHAIKSDAGTGVSGTSFFDEYLLRINQNMNLDILIEDVFYEESSWMVSLAKENHDEKLAYSY